MDNVSDNLSAQELSVLEEDVNRRGLHVVLRARKLQKQLVWIDLTRTHSVNKRKANGAEG